MLDFHTGQGWPVTINVPILYGEAQYMKSELNGLNETEGAHACMQCVWVQKAPQSGRQIKRRPVGEFRFKTKKKKKKKQRIAKPLQEEKLLKLYKPTGVLQDGHQVTHTQETLQPGSAQP